MVSRSKLKKATFKILKIIWHFFDPLKNSGKTLWLTKKAKKFLYEEFIVLQWYGCSFGGSDSFKLGIIYMYAHKLKTCNIRKREWLNRNNKNKWWIDPL